MAGGKTTVLILDEDSVFTLRELSRSCDLAAEDLIAMVEEGVLTPRGASQREWRFPAADLRRIHTALRLQRDLGVNLAGVALALDMMDEMEGLRARLKVLERLLD